MVMRKSVYLAWVPAVFLGLFGIFGGVKDVSARVNVNINFNLGPEPPQEVVLAPGGVYFVPGWNADVFFYSGFWWATRDSYWYRSDDYNGRWVVVDRRYVPDQVHRIYTVPNYREYYGKQRGQRIPYGQWKKKHGGGEREKRGDQGSAREQRGGQGERGDSKEQRKRGKNKNKGEKEGRQGHGGR